MKNNETPNSDSDFSEKNTYLTIPTTISRDIRLTMGAKILYGEILLLSNKEGYCWASNDYLSKMYGTSKKCISRWVLELQTCDYVTMQLTYKKGTKCVDKRVITPKIIYDTRTKMFLHTDKDVSTLWTKMSLPYGQKCPYPMDKNVPDNNIIENYNRKTNTVGTDFFEKKNTENFAGLETPSTVEITEQQEDQSKPDFENQSNVKNAEISTTKKQSQAIMPNERETPKNNEKKTKKDISKEATQPLNIAFEDFWTAYGKTDNEKQAKIEWYNLKDVEREKVMQGISVYASLEKNTKNKRSFQPHACTFLRNELFNDTDYGKIIENSTKNVSVKPKRMDLSKEKEFLK